MAYKIQLPPETLRRLWMLREYCGEKSIIEQVRKSVEQYLKRKEAEIGTSIEDVAEAIQEHGEEESQPKL